MFDKHKHLPKILVAISFLLAGVLIAGILVYTLFAIVPVPGDNPTLTCSSEEKDAFSQTDETKEATEWFDDCDKKGKGIYVLQHMDENMGKKTTSWIVYFNQMSVGDSVVTYNTKDQCVTFDCSLRQGISEKNCLRIISYEGKDVASQLKIKTGDVYRDYTIHFTEKEYIGYFTVRQS